MFTPLRRLALARRSVAYALCLLLAVLAGVCAGSVQAQSEVFPVTPLMKRCPLMGSAGIRQIGGAVDLVFFDELEFRHPETRDRYELTGDVARQHPFTWQLTDYVDYENATGAPLVQFNIDVDELDTTNASRFTVLVYEVDADTVAPAIWTYDWLFENESSEAAQHPDCSWYTMPRAVLDDWLAAVAATVTPQPRVSLYGLGG